MPDKDQSEMIKNLQLVVFHASLSRIPKCVLTQKVVIWGLE